MAGEAENKRRPGRALRRFQRRARQPFAQAASFPAPSHEPSCQSLQRRGAAWVSLPQLGSSQRRPWGPALSALSPTGWFLNNTLPLHRALPSPEFPLQSSPHPPFPRLACVCRSGNSLPTTATATRCLLLSTLDLTLFDRTLCFIPPYPSPLTCCEPATPEAVDFESPKSKIHEKPAAAF